MPVPQLSAHQRRAASARAVQARRVRAEVCRALKAGQIGVDEVLRRAEDEAGLASLRVSTLLLSLPRFGPKRADAALVGLRVAPGRRLRGLGSAQRKRLGDLARESAR